MLKREEVYKALSRFGEDVVRQARSNFKHKNASGKGSRSIRFDLDVFPNSFSQKFKMEDYMLYQDKGVSGTEKKYNTPYSYKKEKGNKGKPSPRHFDKWVIRRGIAPRDDNGKFISRKSLKFALSNYIFKYGIKPSLFFTKAFEKEFRTLPDEIIEAYGLDIEKFMKATLNAK